MKRAFLGLPGPMAVKVILVIVVAIVALIALHFIYEWMGSFLDSGGGVE